MEIRRIATLILISFTAAAQKLEINAGESYTIGVELDSSWSISTLQDIKVAIGPYQLGGFDNDAIQRTDNDYIFKIPLSGTFTYYDVGTMQMQLALVYSDMVVKKTAQVDLAIRKGVNLFSSGTSSESIDGWVKYKFNSPQELTVLSGMFLKGSPGEPGPAGPPGETGPQGPAGEIDDLDTLKLNNPVYYKGSRFMYLTQNEGNPNLFVGKNAGSLSVTSGYNVGLGSYALKSLTSGMSNVAIGYEALANAEGAGKLIGIGWKSFESMLTGVGNDNEAIAIGGEAGRFLSDSYRSVLIGYKAGSKNSSSSNMSSTYSGVYIGYDARSLLSSGSVNEIVIGSTAVGNGSNSVTIGNSSVTNNYFNGVLQAGSFKVAGVQTAPVSSSSSCTAGQIWFSSQYLYFCISSGNIGRAAWSTGW